MSTIGGRIRIRREELGLSQEELAYRMGYKSRSSINKIELDVQNLTQRKIKALADALTPESKQQFWHKTIDKIVVTNETKQNPQVFFKVVF